MTHLPESESESATERVTRRSFPARHGKRGIRACICCLLIVALSGALSARASQGAAEEPMKQPGIEFEIVQLAIDQCLRGDANQALATFSAIKQQLDLTPALLELIQNYEETGCPLPVPLPTVRWGFQLGGGYDNNVNQGIVARSLILGSGPGSIDLELSDVFKPQASSFVVASADASFKLGNFAVGQVALLHRSNPSLSALNLTSLVASAIRPFSWQERPGRVQLDISETWLGGARYQRAVAASAQWLLVPGKQPWLANVSTIRANYATQPDQNSQLTEIAIWREKMLASQFGVFGGISGLQDHALGRRPGGDRAGLRFQFGLTTAWEQWLIQPRLNYLNWRSSEVYSPGLINVQRHHQLAQFDLQLVRPMALDQQLVIEWRVNNARDSVPLFSYNGQSVGVYWRWQL